MSKRKRYTDDFRAGAVLMLQAAGYPDTEGALSLVSRKLNVPRTTLRRWFHEQQNPPPSDLVHEKKLDLVAAIREEIAAVLGEMPEARADADYRTLATALGILVDKLQLLEGRPTERTEQTGAVQVNVRYVDQAGQAHPEIPWQESDALLQ